MCDDQQVPKPATGKTPVRNARIPDEIWLPGLARAEMEGRSASDGLNEAFGEWGTKPPASGYAYTFANWPAAREWASGGKVGALYDDLFAATAAYNLEYVAVAAWLAVTHHPKDVKQQKRVLAGHILRRALAADAAGPREKYRDSRHLSETVQAILERHLPLHEG
jgi:hypothetical protein